MNGEVLPVRTLPRWVNASFVVVVLFLVFWGSWKGSFYNSDDFIYLEMAREMRESGNWWDLQFQGEIAHQRPPLALWLLAASGAAFGENLLALRLPSMLMGLVALGFLFGIGRTLARDERAGWLAVLLLLATHDFYFNVRAAMTDTTLLAGILGFLFFYVLAKSQWDVVLASARGDSGMGRGAARSGGSRLLAYFLLAGVCWGWTLMSKSVVAVVPVSVAFLDLLTSGRFGLLRRREPWLGVLMGLLVALPWHLGMTFRHGSGFWKEYIGFNVLQRASSSLFFQPDVWYYFKEMVAWEGALVALVAASLGVVLYVAIRHRDEAARLALLFVVVAFLPFQVSGTRLYHYFIPTMSALMLVSALALHRFFRFRGVSSGSVALALLLFVSNNLGKMFEPDFSPDQRRFVQAIRESGKAAEARVASLNFYEMAVFHQLRQPLDFMTTDPKFYAVIDGEPFLHRLKAARLMTWEKVRRELSEDRPFFLVTRKEDLSSLCAPPFPGCGPGGWTVVDGHIAVLVSNVAVTAEPR